MDKKLKALLNSLHCPICRGQIDIAGVGISRLYNFCCAANNMEYMLFVNDAVIIYDKVKMYDGCSKYIIDQQYDTGKTIFDIWKVDAERNLANYASKTITCDYILFDYQNTDKDRIVKRIKTVMVFG